MITLAGPEMTCIRHLFGAEHVAFVLEAMIAGNTPARAWTEDRDTPRTALIWDGVHTVYLAGAIECPQEWRELFDRQVAVGGPGLLKAYVPGSTAGTVFSGYPVQSRERVLYRADPAACERRPQPLPAGFEVSSITERFAELNTLDNFADVIAEIESCWRSLDDFRRSGFGFVAHDEDRVVCWCTAEYVSDRHCGIGIETVPSYQRRGFAVATGSALVRHCADRRMVGYWDAWKDNRASVAAAEKIGLRAATSYTILVGDFSAPRS